MAIRDRQWSLIALPFSAAHCDQIHPVAFGQRGADLVIQVFAFAYATLKGTEGAICGGCTVKDTWLGTLRGRLGYSFNRWLPYLTGGLAYGSIYVSTPGGAIDRTKGGWTVGGGLEYDFLGYWSAKLEYLYVDLGSATCSYTTCVMPSDTTVDFKANSVRFGLNYRF